MGVARLLTGHQVDTVQGLGWQALSNGSLLLAAETAEYDVLVTCDQNITSQQNMRRRKIRLVVLWTNRWPDLRADPDRVRALVE